MPRADLYVLQWSFNETDDDWAIVPAHIAQAAFSRKADADELLDDLRREALSANVRYRIRRAAYLDKPTKPGRAPRRKRVRRSPPPAMSGARKRGQARGSARRSPGRSQS